MIGERRYVMWRPDGWKNSYKEFEEYLATSPANCPSVVPEEYSAVYEKGADAILEALIGKAKEIHDLPVLSWEHIEQALTDGTWVFIPDETEE